MVSVQWMNAAVKALKKQHGDRFLSSHGAFNEFLQHLGEAERAWKALKPVAPDPPPADPEPPT
jgi:hypothetical protein